MVKEENIGKGVNLQINKKGEYHLSVNNDFDNLKKPNLLPTAFPTYSFFQTTQDQY